MKKKFKNSTKILLVSLIVLLGLFSVNSITVRADKGDDDDDEYEYKYSKDYKERNEKDEDEEKEYEVEYQESAYYTEPIAPSTVQEVITYEEEYYTEEMIEKLQPVILKEEPLMTQGSINQFSDSDNDGVSDALDQHPGEDDLIYAVKDINEDGVVDGFGI